jgi:hypothetical protein
MLQMGDPTIAPLDRALLFLLRLVLLYVVNFTCLHIYCLDDNDGHVFGSLNEYGNAHYPQTYLSWQEKPTDSSKVFVRFGIALLLSIVVLFPWPPILTNCLRVRYTLQNEIMTKLTHPKKKKSKSLQLLEKDIWIEPSMPTWCMKVIIELPFETLIEYCKIFNYHFTDSQFYSTLLYL